MKIPTELWLPPIMPSCSLDAAKGLEPQTRKLFEVCRLRNLPLFTFVNKMDRPALTPYEIVDQIEQEFGLETHPILWPIGDGERFKGVLDRTTNVVHLYTRPAKRGAKAEVREVPVEDEDTLKTLINDDELLEKLLEDVELLQELIPPLDMDRVKAATQSPLFFGSAMTNFGVQLFLDKFSTNGNQTTGENGWWHLRGRRGRESHDWTRTRGVHWFCLQDTSKSGSETS